MQAPMQVRMEPEQVLSTLDGRSCGRWRHRTASDMRVSMSQAAPGPAFRLRSQNSRWVGFAYTSKTAPAGVRAPRLEPNRWNYYTSVVERDQHRLNRGTASAWQTWGATRLQSGDTVSAQELPGDLSIKM
jgi:hypothetical protein